MSRALVFKMQLVALQWGLAASPSQVSPREKRPKQRMKPRFHIKPRVTAAVVLGEAAVPRKR